MSLFNAFTASRWLRGRDAQPGRLREERPYWAVVLASGPLYLIVLAHTPLVLIFDSPHDDELFMTLGQHIAIRSLAWAVQPVYAHEGTGISALSGCGLLARAAPVPGPGAFSLPCGCYV